MTRVVAATPRVLARVVSLVVVVLALGIATPSPASAHATLLFTTPAVDGAVPDSPAQIQMVFDQAVAPAGPGVTVTGPDGDHVALGELGSRDNGQTLVAPVQATLAPGQYVVEWFVTAADGDTMTGDFKFAVGSSSGLSLTTATTTTRGATAIVALRWMLFAGLALLLGGVLGQRLARRTAISDEPDRPKPWLAPGAILALVGALGLALSHVGAGSLTTGLRSFSLTALFDSGPGRIAAAEALLLTLALLALRLPTRFRVVAATGFAAAVAVAEGLRAHPQTASPGWGALLVAGHLIAAALWIGALAHVIRVALWRRRHGTAARSLIAVYARIALWLALIVLTAGSLAGLTLIDLHKLIGTLKGTTYGKVLVVKLVLVLVALVLALVARWHLSRRRVDQSSLAARVELSTLAVVLAASAGLTAAAPPRGTDVALPFAPPATGPEVAVGGRAGWIGVGADASQGQLVVRLTAPDLNGSVEGQDRTEYGLAGNITGPRDDTARKLSFRGCGTGCFVAPVEWVRGTQTVTLETRADTVSGGSTAITVTWPAAPDPALLEKVRRAMLDVPRIELHEQVTSDTDAGLGEPTTLTISGPEYLKVGPYGSGKAPIVTVLGRHRGETVLALAYPAEATYVRLTVDRSGRISREVLAAPNHLTTRTLVYPEVGGGR